MALFGVVRSDQRTADSSSIHTFPLVLKRLNACVLSPLRTSALIRSTCPLLRGCATEAKHTFVPNSSQYSGKEWLVNWDPLSVMILLGTPKRLTIPWMKVMAAWAVMLHTGCTSGHLVNLSMATKRNRYPPTDRGKGPTMSSPQTAKGQEMGIVYSACAGWCMALA